MSKNSSISVPSLNSFESQCTPLSRLEYVQRFLAYLHHYTELQSARHGRCLTHCGKTSQLFNFITKLLEVYRNFDYCVQVCETDRKHLLVRA
jgi:hypothetical protein